LIQRHHIAYATRSGESLVLKLVTIEHKDEIKILKRLRGSMTPNNHTIPINDFVTSQNGTIIVMPQYC
jgi:predicted protein tyrosine phosphatase